MSIECSFRAEESGHVVFGAQILVHSLCLVLQLFCFGVVLQHWESIPSSLLALVLWSITVSIFRLLQVGGCLNGNR